MKKFKRILSCVMIIMMVMFLYSEAKIKMVLASEGYEVNHVYLDYSITGNNEVTITDCSSFSDNTDFDIPYEIEGKLVTSIGEEAFSNCSSLESITIPDSVTSIGDYAFRDCRSLESIIMSNSVTSIGDYAFNGCSSLESITIPNSVTSIGNYTFRGCNNLTIYGDKNSYAETYANQYSIPFREIITNGYYGDSDNFLYSITKNNEIIVKGYSWLSYSNINIPNEIKGKPVTSIENSAFRNFSNLASITIPNSVTSIGNYAFSNCSDYLTSITIPNSVKSIGNYTFKDCSNLESITIPDSVTSIGKGAFKDCKSLESITIPNSVTSIGNSTFYFCLNLSSITIPNSVTSIGDSAFYFCWDLSSIIIPNSVTSIGDSAFDGSGLEIIEIPNSVTSIGEDAFYSCNSLKSITIPNSVTSIGDSAFAFCRSLASITIPDSVTSIGNSTFRGCSNLESITIPNSVTSIGRLAFESCSSLKSITIPNSVTSIGEDAFESCDSLKSIIIPNSVTSIGKNAFKGCSSLTIYGYKNSYVETYAKENGIAFKEITNNNLSITSFTSDKTSPQVSGTAVTLTAKTSGEIGTVEYKYYRYLNGNYDLIKDWSNNSSITITPSIAGKYDIYVAVKDSSGTIVRKNIEFEFKKVLAIDSFTTDKTSPQPVNTEVTLKTNVSGVTGTAQYKYLNGSYSLIKDWSNNSSTTIAPSTAGKYDLWVGVKDESGKTVRKNIEFEFKKALEINSFIADKASPQLVNTEVTLKTNVSGETGTVEYKYYRYLNGNYALIKDWSNNSSITITPSTVGTYDLWVAVKDSTGKIVRKSMKYIIKEQPLKVDLFTTDKISPQEIGTSIKLTAQASGGKGTLQYKFRVGDKDGNYLVIQKFSTSNTATWSADYSGDVILYVDVEDESGRGVTKAINYTIKEK